MRTLRRMKTTALWADSELSLEVSEAAGRPESGCLSVDGGGGSRKAADGGWAHDMGD